MVIRDATRTRIQSIHQFFVEFDSNWQEFGRSFDEVHDGQLLEEANEYRLIDRVDKAKSVNDLENIEIYEIAEAGLIDVLDYVLDSRDGEYIVLSEGYETYSVVKLE